jgi:hypothetical protein
MLRYNALGGAVVRQSDLSAWTRCNLEKKYKDEARADPLAPQPLALSATVYGTVMHYSLMVMEQAHAAGDERAFVKALSTFEHYWHPSNIGEIAEPIQEWLPQQTYGGMLERGRLALRDYYALLVKWNERLLALEFQFAVPLAGTDGRVHTLTGTVDRLSLRKQKTLPYIIIQDWKTGVQPRFLRHNQQGTVYAYASHQRAFWRGEDPTGSGIPDLPSFPDEVLDELEQAFATQRYMFVSDSPLMSKGLSPRKFEWINVRELRIGNGGWRTVDDYARLVLAVEGYVAANEADVYMPTLSGETCQFCPFQRSCGGVGLPAADAGAPY